MKFINPSKLNIFLILLALTASCATSVIIETQELPKAKVNDNYMVEIKTAIEFHANDDYYPRKVLFIRGKLPVGLAFESQENIGIIHGIPTEIGKFEIEILAHSQKLANDIQSSVDREKEEEKFIYAIGAATDQKTYILTVE